MRALVSRALENSISAPQWGLLVSQLLLSRTLGCTGTPTHHRGFFLQPLLYVDTVSLTLLHPWGGAQLFTAWDHLPLGMRWARPQPALTRTESSLSVLPRALRWPPREGNAQAWSS